MTTNYLDNFDHMKPFSDTCCQIALATNVAQTYTIPGDKSQKYRMQLSYVSDSNVYVGYNVTAATPPAGTNTTTGNLEFRPDVKIVKGTDVISCVTPDASAQVGIALLAIPA